MKPFHVHLVPSGNPDLGTRYDQVCERLESETELIACNDTQDQAAGCRNGGSQDAGSIVSRIQLELDGSFVWVGAGWQLDGMMYDRGERLLYVDLKGNCPKAAWDRLTKILAISKDASAIIRLPEGGLHDLQTFEASIWS